MFADFGYSFFSFLTWFDPSFLSLTVKHDHIARLAFENISFCKDRALRISPARTAFQTRLCNRNKFCRNFFQGNFFQDSLLIFPMRLIMIYSTSFVLRNSDQLRSVLPSAWSWDARPSYLGFRPFPEPGIRVFLRSVSKIGWHFRAVQFARVSSRRNSYLCKMLWELDNEVHIVCSDCGLHLGHFCRTFLPITSPY